MEEDMCSDASDSSDSDDDSWGAGKAAVVEEEEALHG